MMPSTGWKNVFSVQKFGTEHHLLHTLGYVLNWCSDEFFFLLLCAQKQFHSKAFTFCRIHGVHSWAQTHTRTACSNWYSLRFFTSKKFMQSMREKNSNRLIQKEWKGVNGCLLQSFDWKCFRIDGSSISHDSTLDKNKDWWCIPAAKQDGKKEQEHK